MQNWIQKSIKWRVV